VICTSFSCNLGTLILLEGIYWGFENSDRGTRRKYSDKKKKKEEVMVMKQFGVGILTC
jgi:hypothetical protein